MSKVMNVTTHPIDLEDGRSLAPGEEADGVDVNDPHNKAHIAGGSLLETAKTKTGRRPSKADSEDNNNTTGEDDS